MRLIPCHFGVILLLALASFASAESISLTRIGVIEAEMFLYDVSAGGVFEYREDWSARASRQASISAALALMKIGYSPIILPDAGRSRQLSNLKTRMRYHGTAFQSDFFSSIGLDDEEQVFSLGPLDSACGRFGVDGFLYTYGYEEKFSPARRQVLLSTTGSMPQERAFVVSMLADRSGRILWYDQGVPEPVALTFGSESAAESVHTESLMAQARAMERRFRNQNLLWEDRDLEGYLDEILDKLVTPEEQRRYNLRVRIIRSNAFDAFAAPDGAIYVCIGLLARVANEAQLAAILAHELGHIVKNHTEKNLQMLKEAALDEVRGALKTQKAKAVPAKSPRPKFTPMTRSKARPRSAASGTPAASTQEPAPAPRRPSSGFSSDMMFRSMTGALRAAVDGYRQELENEADSVAKARMAAAGYPPIENFRQFIQEIADSHYAGTTGDDIEKGYFDIKLRSIALNAAVANHASGRHGWTEIQLDRLLSIDECDPSALLIRGDMERLMSPRSTAWAEWYEKALACDPNDLAVLRATGFAYHAIGNKAKARKYLSKYSELAGDAPDIEMAREALRQCE